MHTRRTALTTFVTIAAAAPALAQAAKEPDATQQQPLPSVPPLDKTLDPSQTALVFVDFQNTFAAPGGETYPHYEKIFKKTGMIEKAVALAKDARALGIQVVQVTEGYSHDYRELDWGNGAGFHRAQILRQAWKSGTWPVQLIDAMKPGPDDKDILLPNRITVNGFGNNGLDTILRNRGIKNIGLGGFSTEGCVYATMLAGYDFGYRMFAITDAMASTREDLSKLMLEDRYPQYSRVVDSAAFIAMASSFETKSKRKPS
jgi:ureidoacrylate peracid hydrolase